MSSKLWCLSGLPGSGKSTKAKEIMDTHNNTFRVNKDSIRQCLHMKDFNPKHEGLIEDMNNLMVNYLIAKGKNVIVDNTHLSESDVNKYKKLAEEKGIHFEAVNLDVPVEECIKRDSLRRLKGERYVGPDVIINMAWRYNIYKSPHNCMVTDLDGTLANCEKRRHFVRNINNDPTWKKNWGAFFKLVKTDTPNQFIVDKIKKVKGEGLDVIIVSARPEYTRKDTEDWLNMYSIPYDRLLMRASNDSRDDEIVKPEIVEKYLDKSKILEWYDDRPKVIRAIRALGINVIDVGNGEEF